MQKTIVLFLTLSHSVLIRFSSIAVQILQNYSIMKQWCYHLAQVTSSFVLIQQSL